MLITVKRYLQEATWDLLNLCIYQGRKIYIYIYIWKEGCIERGLFYSLSALKHTYDSMNLKNCGEVGIFLFKLINLTSSQIIVTLLNQVQLIFISTQLNYVQTQL